MVMIGISLFRWPLKSLLEFFFFLLVGVSLACAASTPIATGGKALVPIMHAPDASESILQSTGDLGSILHQMTGADFTLESGGEPRGIVVGTAAQFSGVPGVDRLDSKDPLRREEYIIHSDGQRVWLIGATDIGASHAVWDLLYRVGYRQYFPTKNWEIIPKISDLTVDMDVFEVPDYKSRRIFYQYGGYGADLLEKWMTKNRAGVAGFNLRTSHAWTGIAKKYQDLFIEHPEWLAMHNGKRRSLYREDSKKIVSSIKFCLSNPAVRRLLAEDALERLASSEDRDSVSLDPSDGGGWCECEACAAMGSISDQLMTVVNEAAKLINATYPNAKVGIYAYHQHGLPPHMEVNPAVIVSVATNLTLGGVPTLELMKGWHQKGAALGIREYYAIYTWHRDLPAGMKASNLSHVASSIRDFYNAGARFMVIEGSNNWGPAGLGYYLAVRTLWDVSEADRSEAIVEEFLEKSFGPAKEPMRRFYRQLRGGKERLPLTDDMVGRMYRALDEARRMSEDPAVLARLQDLTLYTRYVELYRAYAAAEGEQRQKAYEEMVAFALRMRETGMVHSMAVHRDLILRDKNVTMPEGHGWNPSAKKRAENPWFQQSDFHQNEIEEYIKVGIKNNPLVDFEMVGFSDNYVPATPLLQAASGFLEGMEYEPFFRTGRPARGVNSYYFWVDEGKNALRIRTNSNRLIQVYQHASSEEPVAEVDLRKLEPLAEGELREVTIPLSESGLHELLIDGGGRGGDIIYWEEDVKVSVKPDTFPFWGENITYFYVPKGTKVVGVYARPFRGKIYDSVGEAHLDFSEVKKAEYFSIPVPSGQDGSFWRISNLTPPAMRLLTVPPLLARTPEHLLLPAEIVERDAPKQKTEK